VDHDGYVLDETVQARRNIRAAKRLLSRLMKQQGIAPKRIITDKLFSYGAARRQVIPRVEHRSHKDLNNRTKNSHLPLRKRERIMQGFQSPRGLQRFTSVFAVVRNLLVPTHSHQFTCATHLHRLQAIAAWKAVAGAIA
jgi:putative transposase